MIGFSLWLEFKFSWTHFHIFIGHLGFSLCRESGILLPVFLCLVLTICWVVIVISIFIPLIINKANHLFIGLLGI